MAKAKRDIGREILQGLREIKSGQHGRVVNLPGVASIREKTGLSQERFATLLGVSVRTPQDGSRAAGRRQAWLARCCSSQNATRRRCSMSRDTDRSKNQ